MIIAGVAYIVYVKTYYSRLSEKTRDIITSIKNKLIYNSVLRMLLQTYLNLCVSAMVTLNYGESALQVTAGLILFLILSVSPILVVYTLTKKRLIPIDHPMTIAKIGSLYLNVETDGKYTALLYTPLFLVRRLIFAVIVVTVKENGPLQILTTMHFSLLLILFYVMVWPMSDTVNNMLQLVNEIFFFVLTTFLLAFTDLVVDPVKHHKIGFAYLGLLVINVLANVALIARTLNDQVKDYCRKRKQKKLTEVVASKPKKGNKQLFKSKRTIVGGVPDLERNNNDQELGSEGSLRGPGMPLPPLPPPIATELLQVNDPELGSDGSLRSPGMPLPAPRATELVQVS